MLNNVGPFPFLDDDPFPYLVAFPFRVAFPFLEPFLVHAFLPYYVRTFDLTQFVLNRNFLILSNFILRQLTENKAVLTENNKVFI